MSTSDTVDVATQHEHLAMAVQLSRVNASEIVLPEDRSIEVNGLGLHYLD